MHQWRNAWAEEDPLRKGQLPADSLRKTLLHPDSRRLVGAMLAKIGLRKDAIDLEERWKDYLFEQENCEHDLENGDRTADEIDWPTKPKWPTDDFYGAAGREDDSRVTVTDAHIDAIYESRDLPILLFKHRPDHLLEQYRVGYGDSLYAFMQVLCLPGHCPEPIKSRPMIQKHLADWHGEDPDKRRPD